MKPQFEDSKATKNGVLEDEGRRREIVEDVMSFAKGRGYEILGEKRAAIRGAKGNQEQTLHLNRPCTRT